MSEQITTFIAQPFEVPAGLTVYFNDPDQIDSVPSGWYRIFLAPTAGTGLSMTNPRELIGVFQGLLTLHSDGVLAMTASGRLSMTTATGFSLDFTSSREVGIALGFDEAVLSFASGTTLADRPPLFCVQSHYRRAVNDRDYQGAPAFQAISRSRGGRVDVLTSRKVSITRKFALAAHPRTPSEMAGLSFDAATPVYPDVDDFEAWTDPSPDMDTTPAWWTIHRSVHTGMGLEFGYTLGSFRELVEGSISYYDLGYWTEETPMSTVAISAPPWISLSERDGLELTRLGTGGTVL